MVRLIMLYVTFQSCNTQTLSFLIEIFLIVMLQ